MDAVRCRYCGESIGRQGGHGGTGRLSPTPRSAQGDKTLTVVVALVLGFAALFGGVLWLVIQGMRQGQPTVSGQASGHSSISTLPSSPPMSMAFSRGYEVGKWSGGLDRRYDTYSHFTREEADKRLTASRHGYRPGSDEYGDFWAGYQAGYLEAR